MIYPFLICLVAGTVVLASSLLVGTRSDGKPVLRALLRFVPFFGVGGLVAEGMGAAPMLSVGAAAALGAAVAILAAVVER